MPDHHFPSRYRSHRGLSTTPLTLVLVLTLFFGCQKNTLTGQSETPDTSDRPQSSTGDNGALGESTRRGSTSGPTKGGDAVADRTEDQTSREGETTGPLSPSSQDPALKNPEIPPPGPTYPTPAYRGPDPSASAAPSPSPPAATPQGLPSPPPQGSQTSQRPQSRQPAAFPSPSSPVAACSPDRPPTVAHVHVAVTLISNMEHGFHILEEGAIFQIVQNNRVVIAGHATIDAVRNGRPTDGNGAYPGVILRLEATYSDVNSAGTGTLFMCQGALGVAPHLTQCQQTPALFKRDPARPVEIRGHQIRWAYRGGSQGLNLLNGGRLPELDVSGSNITVSAYHPVFAAAAPGAAFKDFQSPLVLDLNRNGKFDLIDVWDERFTVRFDLEAKGEPVRTGWVAPEDGLLALDVDGNGRIDSGRELFGEQSHGPQHARGQADRDPPFDDGFMALRQFDGNHDGLIDGKDSIFSRLLVWSDANSDGISQKGELRPLKAYRVSALSLKTLMVSHDRDRVVRNNLVKILSEYRTPDGQAWGVADVWFKTRRYTDGLIVHQIHTDPVTDPVMSIGR